MKYLLIVTAVLELGAGLALLVLPSALVWLLVGSPLEAPAAQIVARVGGAGLTTLGIACSFASGDALGRAAKGLVAAMLFYNVAVVAILAYANIGIGLHGVAIWPAFILHLAMAAWCIVLLVRMPAKVYENAKQVERKSP